MQPPLVHALTIVRTDYGTSIDAYGDPQPTDEYGQPLAQTPVGTEVMGLAQPKRAVEMADSRSAGSELADWVIFLPVATDIRNSDSILWGSRRFNVTGLRRFEFGRLNHIEVDARLVTADPLVEAGS